MCMYIYICIINKICSPPQRVLHNPDAALTRFHIFCFKKKYNMHFSIHVYKVFLDIIVYFLGVYLLCFTFLTIICRINKSINYYLLYKLE